MERLTEKENGQNVIPLRQDGKLAWSLCDRGMGDEPTQYLYGVHADKLAQYEDLEEQGKLLKLPCMVGDTYYRIENDGANPPRIREWEVRTLEFCINVIGEIGKSVFLTFQEAEAKLAEMGEKINADTAS